MIAKKEVAKLFFILILLFPLTGHVNGHSARQCLANIPKAHLSIHLEGSLTTKLYWKFAERNHLKIPYASRQDLKNRIENLTTLSQFLSLYYANSEALQKKQDYYELMTALLRAQHKQGVVHLEIQFDPDSHLHRGVKLNDLLDGITAAVDDFNKHTRLSVLLIPAFLRDKPQELALSTLNKLIYYAKQHAKFKAKFVAIGLDSDEKDNPPSKFYKLFELARKNNLKIIPHGGHDELAQPYISEFLINCNLISRLDHGNMASSDKQVIKRLKQCKIPLALCPISEVKIGPINNLASHPAHFFMKQGLVISINADDPAYLNADLLDNYLELSKALRLNNRDIKKLIINSFRSSLLKKTMQDKWIKEVLKSRCALTEKI
ncbi:adenosine deaminase [Legionella beliardensis]|nr:adenosine deaminase [Legionella beliardensis]